MGAVSDIAGGSFGEAAPDIQAQKWIGVALSRAASR
jgi:hypothetical protein